MFWLCEPDIGCGDANCVADVVVEVEAGGARAKALIGFAGAGTGVADWKSSNSSSSAVLDWRTLKSANAPEDAGAFPLLEDATTGSSPKSKRSSSGSWGFAGAFLASRLAAAGDETEPAFRLPGAATTPSSYSSYSSYLSRFVDEDSS